MAPRVGLSFLLLFASVPTAQLPSAPHSRAASLPVRLIFAMVRFALAGVGLQITGRVRRASFRSIRSLLLPLIFWFAPVAHAQQQGVPAFSVTSSGPTPYESVDVATGSVLLSVPIRNKAGLIPFSFGFQGSTSIWISGNCCVYTINANPLFQGVSPYNIDVGGYLTHFGHTATCPNGQHTTVEDHWTLVDEIGTNHSFPNLATDSLNCLPSVLKDTAVDGSGLSADLTVPYPYAVYTSSGATISPGNSVTDTNGNKIYRTVVSNTIPATDQYTDTLGQTVLTAVLNQFNPPYSNGVGPNTWSWTDAAGATRTVSVSYSPFTGKTNFQCPPPGQGGAIQDATYTVTWNLPTTISLPDGSSFTITYEQTPGFGSGYTTGRIASIVFPTGGQVTYTYSGNNNGFNCSFSNPGVSILTKTYTNTDGTTATWKYDAQTLAATHQVIVTDPALNDTVYTFASLFASGPTFPTALSPVFESQRQIYRGSRTTGTLLMTMITCYNGNSVSNPSGCVDPSTIPAYPIKKL